MIGGVVDASPIGGAYNQAMQDNIATPATDPNAHMKNVESYKVWLYQNINDPNTSADLKRQYQSTLDQILGI